jgi:hypothetical protein
MGARVSPTQKAHSRLGGVGSAAGVSAKLGTTKLQATRGVA